LLSVDDLLDASKQQGVVEYAEKYWFELLVFA